MLRDDDVPEQRGEVEAYSGYGVVAIDFHQLVGEVEEADVARPVDELPLELEECVLVLVERGEGGDIIVLAVVFHDAEFPDFAELAVNGDAVRPGEEALLLPAQLRDLAAGLGVVVEIGLYLVEAVLAALEEEVAETFAPQPERRDRYEVFLAQLQHLAPAVNVFETVEPFGVDGADDVEERLHHEVRPLEETVALERVEPVAVMLGVEPVLAYLVFLLLGLPFERHLRVFPLKFFLPALHIVNLFEGVLPQGLAWNLLRQQVGQLPALGGVAVGEKGGDFLDRPCAGHGVGLARFAPAFRIRFKEQPGVLLLELVKLLF